MISFPAAGGYTAKYSVPERPWWAVDGLERSVPLGYRRSDGLYCRSRSKNDLEGTDKEHPLPVVKLCPGQVWLLEAQQVVLLQLLDLPSRIETWTLGGKELRHWTDFGGQSELQYHVLPSEAEGFLLRGNSMKWVSFLIFDPLGQHPWTGCTHRPWEKKT
jgi:hypothetical protein